MSDGANAGKCPEVQFKEIREYSKKNRKETSEMTYEEFEMFRIDE